MLLTLIAPMLVVSGLARTVAPTHPLAFEITPDCMLKRTEGRCVVRNKFKAPIECKITVYGDSILGVRLSNVQNVVIPADNYNDSARIYSPRRDVLVSVNATAECKTE